MNFSKIKKSLDQSLSEGRGTQFLWLTIAILITLVAFLAVSFLFLDKSLTWQDIMALFLDPGTFAGPGEHDIFRLLAVFAGMLLFSALLISVVSNIFENIADAFKLGLSRYNHTNHVLILGGSRRVYGMLEALCRNNAGGKEDDIVIMTSQPVEKFRDSLFSCFDGETGKALRKRLTIYHGERDNEDSLRKKDLAKNARIIYIIGEDQETDHDSVSVNCSRILQGLCCGTGHSVPCYMVLNNETSFDVYKYSRTREGSVESDLKVDVISASEQLAEQVLVATPDKEGHRYPVIDYRSVARQTDQNGKLTGIMQEVGITEDTQKYVHFVVAGMSETAQAMALTAAHICHFPNFKEGKFRTVITFIDADMAGKMNEFISAHQGLFTLSHHEYVSVNPEGKTDIKHISPDPQFGDFLDIEWQFIDASIYDPRIREMLSEWAQDSGQSLSLAICQERQEENISCALHLPRAIYNSGVPVFVWLQERGEILDKAKESLQFGNLHTFGMASDSLADPLFETRARIGKRINFVYDQHQKNPEYRHTDETSAWYELMEAHKFSSIYCGNSIAAKARSFNLMDWDVSKLSGAQRQSLYEVEHRRWMMSDLILGYAPADTATRHTWLELRHQDEEAAHRMYKQLKTNFIHLDIMPFEDLPEKEKEKDQLIVDNYPYIMGNAEKVINPELFY